MLSLHDKGKNTFWKMFITGVARHDDAWAFVCSLYGIGVKDAKGIL